MKKTIISDHKKLQIIINNAKRKNEDAKNKNPYKKFKENDLEKIQNTKERVRILKEKIKDKKTLLNNTNKTNKTLKENEISIAKIVASIRQKKQQN